MRGVCWSVKMGLFLHAVGSVTPTESAAERSLLRCEGVNNQSYFCESGHCCGESQCCSYYYELWWFLPNYLLPDYEEVVNRPPTPPPPYTSLHTGPSSGASSPLAPEQQDGHCPAIQSSPASPVPDGMCCRPSTEEPQPSTLDLRPKPDNKSIQTAQNSDTILLSGGLNTEELSSQEKRSGSGENCKDPLLKDFSLPEGCTEDKERLPNGRRRRFTGDSGIEVCVCGTRGSSSCGAGGTGQDSKELRELESLLGHNMDDDDEEEGDESSDFCDSCSHRASFNIEEEQAPGGLDRRVGHGPAGTPQPPQNAGSSSLHQPACLLLQTINEQDGPAYSTSTEPQG
ncbi:WW domain binding protein 1-like b isoform 2-T2 [Xenentodon cancila]